MVPAIGLEYNRRKRADFLMPFFTEKSAWVLITSYPRSDCSLRTFGLCIMIDWIFWRPSTRRISTSAPRQRCEPIKLRARSYLVWTLLQRQKNLGQYILHLDRSAQLLFCDNESNNKKLYGVDNIIPYCKDGINEFLVHGNDNAINIDQQGTKAAANYNIVVKAGQSETIRLRLEANGIINAFEDFDNIFNSRLKEADEFYHDFGRLNFGTRKFIQGLGPLIFFQAIHGSGLWPRSFHSYRWAN